MHLRAQSVFLIFIVLLSILRGIATTETSFKRITKLASSTTTAQMPNLSSKDSTADNLEITAPTDDLCNRGLEIPFSSERSGEEETPIPEVRHEQEFVYVLKGDIVLSVITMDPTSALFVMNQVNNVNILAADFKFGLRAISVQDVSFVESLLIQEVQYQQKCITHGIGIFIDHTIYQILSKVIKDLEYNIWEIPATHSLLFPKVAHLLYQMPWVQHISSVEIITESLEVYNDFIDAIRKQHMCLMHFKSDENIYILLGSKMSDHLKRNGTIFAVPIDRTDRIYIAGLPDKSFIFLENEIEVKRANGSSADVSLGKSVLPSKVVAFAQLVMRFLLSLNDSIALNCERSNETFSLKTCPDFLKHIQDWNTDDNVLQPIDLLTLLDKFQINQLNTSMEYKIYQKRLIDNPERGEKDLKMLEIASMNFVKNVTTYFHYNRANQTSLELKTKFGHAFNCQYNDGYNSRYPSLFDGESVMFWRLKPDSWVAIGFTAGILGTIVTLAILVFIIVRISMGDVFEGNPVTSILLLLSLLLIFTSFVPFSLEYVGEYPNSHITFDDAQTLNTLCAVRIFIMTLVYCFTFSILLCRAVMLASNGSEGSFLSHINGYIQALICTFSICVQLGMSVQFLVVMHVASEILSCENIYYGNWMFAVIAYDFILLLSIVILVPFIYRSKRNYREGILIVIGAVLAFIIWLVWITVSFFGDEFRDAAIAIGLQATGWAILVGVLIPRSFLIVRGIERSDIVQALPSLTSLTFSQNNQCSSEQSFYECVNPAMRYCSHEEIHQNLSEVPTLPLRSGGPRRQQVFPNLRQASDTINPQRPQSRPQRGSPVQPSSQRSSLPGSPDSSKITRF